MKQSEEGFLEYYKYGQYKDFYKHKVRCSPLTGQIHVTFTNGITELFASGRYKEEALKKIFVQINKLASCKNGRPSPQMVPHNWLKPYLPTGNNRIDTISRRIQSYFL